MKDLEQKLGFDKVRELIKGRCSTKYAIKRVEEEQVLCEEEPILQRLQLTAEMKLICMFEESFPSTGFIDARDFLVPLLAQASCIDLTSLIKLRTALDTLKKTVLFFNGNKGDAYPKLKAMAGEIALYPEVSRRVDVIIDKYGEVRDTASDNLLTIRRSLREKEGTITKRISNILKKAQADGIVDEDAAVSIREGKALIPIASGSKKKLPGLVYDESSSGKTSFVEPLEVVELNNQVRELRFEEQREIAKILYDFTVFLRPYLEDLIAGAEFLGEIDFIRAKAYVALDMIAGMPIISHSGELSLRKARHPLLESALRKENKEIVPLTLFLNRDKHILLISGPNAGGKSVCLKTVGLLQYMFQWGTLIPISEISELTIFNDIFVDIGDDQSLENDLSTYSSHLYNMKEMVGSADSYSLVLIDEFGSGTEPAAGGAIAEAVLSELDKAGVYGVITTHYTNLKLYANNSTGVTNGAMLFDTANIKPLFKLEMGLPGNSFAFELARKIGLPEYVIKNAEERAGSEFVDIERHLRKIARNKRAIDEKLVRIKATDKTLEGLTEKYEKELGDIKAMKKKIIDEAKDEAKEIISEANKKIEKTVREIKEAQAEKEKTKELRKEIEEFSKKIETDNSNETDREIDRKMEQILARRQREKERKQMRLRNSGNGVSVVSKKVEVKEDGPLKVGDKVRIKDNDMIGEVMQISAKYVSISTGDIISKIAASKLERISNQQYKSSIRKSVSSRPVTDYDSTSISERRLDFKPSIDVRGCRLYDAIDQVTKFIDDALMVGMGEVKILHGKGNGVLREEIRKYLKSVPGVNSFKDESLEQGGSGITVVYLE